MGIYEAWAHGSALTVESPELLATGGYHHGRGAVVTVKPGEGGWCHIPLPVPAAVDGAAVTLTTAFLLCGTAVNGWVDQVHLYDGSELLQQFNLDDTRRLGGTAYLSTVGPNNTFTLTRRRRVLRGISLSFFYQGTLGPGNELVVPAAGARYDVAYKGLVGEVARFLGRIRIFARAP